MGNTKGKLGIIIKFKGGSADRKIKADELPTRKVLSIQTGMGVNLIVKKLKSL